MKPDSSNVDIRISGTGDLWGNWFFTESWTLYIDLTSQQHEQSMRRLGIVPESVEFWGHFRGDYAIIREEGDWELKRPVKDLIAAKLRELNKGAKTE